MSAKDAQKMIRDQKNIKVQMDLTQCFTDLDKHNNAKLGNGSLVLGLNHFLILLHPPSSKSENWIREYWIQKD